MPAHQWLLFIAAGVLLNLTPGPDVFFIIAHAARRGVRAGVVAALGISAGCCVHVLAAAVGVSALVAASATAFGVLKWLGAIYLVYVGVRMLLAARRGGAPSSARPGAADAAVPLATVFRRGFLTNVLNPKVALFFLAFLPQFVDPGRGHVLVQFLVLGATMAVLDTLYELALVCVFARLRGRYLADPRVSRWQSRVSGVVLVALGLRLASQGR